MKYFSLSFLALVLASSATAQNIRWQPIGENAPVPMEPFKGLNPKPPTTTYRQVGPLTFGSDGSRAYSTDQQTITRQANGELIPDLVYVRGADGTIKRCKKYGENMFCE